MSSTVEALSPPSKALVLLEGRAVPEFGAFWLMRPWLSATTSGDGHPVLVLPGLLADDMSTRPLRGFLNSHGYKAHGWKQGRNLRLRGGVESDMLARVDELYERHGGRKISLIGWSLGGLYARQLAKIAPHKVRCMISLGSPFAGSPKATNAWRVYELASGSKPRSSAAPTASAPGRPASTRTALRSRISRSMAATSAWATIRQRSMQSPTAWRSRKASGRNSIAAAGARWSSRIGGGSRNSWLGVHHCALPAMIFAYRAVRFSGSTSYRDRCGSRRSCPSSAAG